jgi:hypothetical protein
MTCFAKIGNKYSDALLCPNCQEANLHQEGIAEFVGSGDQTTVLYFWCEFCHEWGCNDKSKLLQLRIQFHKGSTYMEWL